MKKSVFFVTGVLFLFFSICLENQVFAQSGVAPTCASLTAGSSYSQDFDSLATSGTSSTVPAGFGFAEVAGATGNTANNTYAVSTGSSTAGDTYSLGTDTTPPADRAFGSLQSGSIVPTIGACFVNDTGAIISSLTITYDGEMYRLGSARTSGALDRLDFQYSTNATSLTVGDYTDVDALDFTTPNLSGSGGTRDGNNALFRTAGITTTFAASIPVGQTFYIRYLDFNVEAADDALAIDNFVLTANAVTAAPAVISGRVTVGSRGASREMVMLSGGDLEEPIYTTTNTFGYYKFDELTVGETYVVQVISKRYRFTNPSMVIGLQDNISNADFIAVTK